MSLLNGPCNHRSGIPIFHCTLVVRLDCCCCFVGHFVILSVVAVVVASVVIAIGASVSVVVPVVVPVVISVGCSVFFFSFAFAAFDFLVPIDSTIVTVAIESYGAVVVSSIGVFLPRVRVRGFTNQVDCCLVVRHELLEIAPSLDVSLDLVH